MTTLENRPTPHFSSSTCRTASSKGRPSATRSSRMSATLSRRRGRSVPVVWVQHSDEEGLAKGSDALADSPRAGSGRGRAARREDLRRLLRGHQPRDRACRASESGDSSSSVRRPMRASARLSTARSPGGTNATLSATLTRRRTRRPGGRRRPTRSSRTRTCTGPIRRRRGGRPGRSRPRMSTSAAHPEGCATQAGAR